MASPADRFTRLEKLAIFLIALGQERAREILADVDVDTLQHLNEAMAGLGEVSAEEKAAVMLEFAHFFYADEPLGGKAGGGPPGPAKTAGPPSTRRDNAPAAPPLGEVHLAGQGSDLTDEERAILKTLDRLRRRIDPGQIDWGRAGYDFGEGFKGPDDDRRR